MTIRKWFHDLLYRPAPSEPDQVLNETVHIQRVPIKRRKLNPHKHGRITSHVWAQQPHPPADETDDTSALATGIVLGELLSSSSPTDDSPADVTPSFGGFEGGASGGGGASAGWDSPTDTSSSDTSSSSSSDFSGGSTDGSGSSGDF